MIAHPCPTTAAPGGVAGSSRPENPPATAEPSALRPADASDRYAPSEGLRRFRAIVGGYDVTSMSRNEMGRMARELYDGGLIDLKELGSLTFDPTRLGREIERATGVRVGDRITVSGWAMSTDPDRKMDFLEGFRTKAEWNRRHGDPAFQGNYDGMVALLERIHRFQA